MLLAQYTEENGIGLGKIFDKVKISAEDYSDVIEKIANTSLGDVLDGDRLSVEKLSNAIGSSDIVILDYAQTLKDTEGNIDLTTASTEGLSNYLEKSGNMFNFAAIKATLLNTALNAGIFLVASLAIQGIVKALDNYIHRVEKARERTDELFDEFKQMNDTLADHKKTVSELADRYDELSKGVNLSTNDNISLSTEEYEEFLDINEQMAQSFPELAKGIDENGNSILTLGTKGITAKEQLEELLQTEEDLNNFRIAQGLEEAFKGVYTYVEDANEATEKLNGTISDSNEAMSKLQDIAENGIKLTGENGQLIFAGNINNQAELDYMNSLTQSVNGFWKSLDGNRRVELDINPSDLFTQNMDEYSGVFEIYANLYQLTPEEITALESIIQDNVGDASGALLDSISDQSQELQEQINKGENAWRDFIPNLVSGMKSKQTFKDLDSDLRDIAVQIVEGLDYSYASAMKEYDPDPYAYIRDKFIVPMGNLNDSDRQKLQSSFEELLKLDADNLSKSNQAEIEKFITTIATLLGKDPLEIRVALGFDIEDTQNRYNEALKRSKRQLNGYGHDDRGFETNNTVGDKLDDFWNENVVTEDDLVLWQKVTTGIDNATDAMEAYTEAKKNANSVNVDKTGISPLSISQTIDQLNTQLKPAMDSLHSAWQDMFNDDGKFDLKSVDILSTCDTIKSKLDEMSDPEGLNLDVDYSAFEDFVRVLNNTESKEHDVENAFDSLATSITQAALSGAEDFETMKAALEDLGVVNNEMVAFQALASNTEMLEQALSEANASMDDFIVNTEDGSVEATNAGRAFLEEKVGAENCAEALNILAFHKQLCNLQEMNTAGEVANLKTLAENAGYTGEVIQYLTELEQIYQEVASGTLTPVQIGAKIARAAILKSMIDSAASKVQYAPKVDWSGAVKDAGKAGKDSGKSYKDKLKEELSDLDSVISGITGRIDDQISSINEQKSAALESIDAQKEALEEAKDAAVEALEAERDARLEVIETQKEQLEEQIKLIDKQIKQKQDEIDAINDAADARKRELDLQKAQYELERMQNQRTILQYSEDKGMHYVNDTKGIRDTKEAVDEAKRQIEIANIQKEIDLLEDQKDLLSEQITLLDEQADAVNKYYDEQIKQTEKYYDSLIKNLEKQRKETEAYYESLTKSLEQRKDKFQELTEILEKAELSAKLKQLGIDEEALLNGSEEEFEKLKNAYMNIVMELNKGNDDVLNALRDLSGYEGTAPSVLEESNDKLGTMNDELGDANGKVDKVNSSLTETASTTGTVATNVGTVVDGLNELPDSSKISGLSKEFEILATKIGEVAKALGIGEGEATSTLLQAMSNLNTVTLGNEGEGIIGQFTLLKNAITDVIDTIGSTEAQTVGSLMSAIAQLNSISLDETIITQFNNLETAINQVTAAISGGSGEPSEGASSGGESGSKGGKQGGSGGKGGKGSEGESGGGNSLTGAIESMGETAKEVIGEPDAEGDGTVIGEFGSMETAVNDVRDAIGTEGGEGEGGGSGSGGETDDTLVGSIEYLGDKTEEEMGESGGDGIIGRFEEFRDVIGEADEHVKSISDGLDNIDGKEVSCTIKINIIRTESGGGGGDSAAGESELLGSMNMNSATYNAQYKGNAHYEGTAKVTGDWGVKEGGKTLCGEMGQEIVVRGSKFFTVGDNGAEFVNLQKGDLVFNHLQTKELLSKGNIVGRGRALASGTALANGTSNNVDDSIWTTLADGTRVRDLQPGDKMYDMMQKFDAYFNSMDGNLEKLVPNSVYEHQRQMEDMAKQINYVSSVVNNNRNVQQPVNQTFNITMPNVTDSTSAASLMNDLQSLATKKYQVDW